MSKNNTKKMDIYDCFNYSLQFLFSIILKIEFFFGYEHCCNSSLRYSGTLSRCFSMPFYSSKSPITTITDRVFRCYIFSTTISRSLYFDSLSNSDTEKFLSAETFASLSL